MIGRVMLATRGSRHDIRQRREYLAGLAAQGRDRRHVRLARMRAECVDSALTDELDATTTVDRKLVLRATTEARAAQHRDREFANRRAFARSEEPKSEIQSLKRISYDVF